MSAHVAPVKSLLAVVAATLDLEGQLLAANAGFLRLIESPGRPALGSSSARYFLQPDFMTLSTATPGNDGEIHRGLLTVGDFGGKTRTLRGQAWREGERICVLAEFDIDGLEQLNDTLLDLNRDYANAQLELAHAYLRLQQHDAQVVSVSLTDPLTNVGNRRRLELALTQEIGRAQRNGGQLCVLMADLDEFKQVNDRYGHEFGDRVLIAVASLLRRQTRSSDIVTRFGGEEFLILLPHTDLTHALSSAERIREALLAMVVSPVSERVTASFGVAEWIGGESVEALLRRADAAMYAAKQAGRNCVVAAEHLPSHTLRKPHD